MIAVKSRVIDVESLPHQVMGVSGDPLSKTGSNSLGDNRQKPQVESRIDNCTLLWDCRNSRDICGTIDRFLGIRFDEIMISDRKIGIVWDRTWSSPTGTLYSQRDTCDGQIKCRLSLSGQDCERATNGKLRGFLLWAATNLSNITCTRIDLAVDDYTKSLEYSDIEQALTDGNYSGVRSGRVTKNYGSKLGGFTVNLGSRESEKFVRFYDKFAQSGGHMDCYRFEVEYKGDLADAVFRLVLEFPKKDEEYQRSIINHALSCVDFIDKNDKNIGRNLRLGWWDAWLSRLKCTTIKVRVGRIKTAINAKKNWVQRSVSKTLAMLTIALGDVRMEHFLYEIVDKAKARINSMDELLLSDYAKNGHLCYAAGMIE